jgi:hypothetical protein
MLSTSADVDEPIDDDVVANVVIASLLVSISVVVATDDVEGLTGMVVDETVLIVDVDIVVGINVVYRIVK